MRYSRTQVREALLAARRDGKPLEALKVGDRETEIQLERLGYLPLDQDAVDKRIQDWYTANGLAMRADTPVDTTDDTPGDTPEVTSSSTSSAAIEAAEAALVAASAALRLAKAMAS